MSVNIKYKSEETRRLDGGREYTVTYYGSRTELAALMDRLPVGLVTTQGRVSSLDIRQGEADIWELAVQYSYSAGGETAPKPPDYAFGHKSASLDTSMLSLAIEKAKKYRYKWNHYLFWRPSYRDEPMPDTPSWYDDDTGPGNATGQWAWGSDTTPPPSDTEFDFRIVHGPTKPGVQSFDWPVPTVTESARFRSASDAGNYVGARINEIGSPDNTFGYFSGHVWKCDRAHVSWTGEYWLATLTWTGSPGLWDSDLYGPGSGLREEDD